MNDFGTEFEQKGVIGGDILYIAMHALCNKKQSITFTGHLKYALNMRIIVQTQAHIFRNDWELELDGLEPLAVRLPLLIDLDFG